MIRSVISRCPGRAEDACRQRSGFYRSELGRLFRTEISLFGIGGLAWRVESMPVDIERSVLKFVLLQPQTQSPDLRFAGCSFQPLLQTQVQLWKGTLFPRELFSADSVENFLCRVCGKFSSFVSIDSVLSLFCPQFINRFSRGELKTRQQFLYQFSAINGRQFKRLGKNFFSVCHYVFLSIARELKKSEWFKYT